MLHRFSALVLALAIAGVPLAATVCQVTCAAHDARAGRSHHHDGHHHSCPPAATDAAAAVRGVPHACGDHGDETAGLQQQMLQLQAAPAVTAATQEPGIAADSQFRNTNQHHPPGVYLRTTQLRV